MKLMKLMMDKGKKFGICEWSLMKSGLIVLGIIIGAYISSFVKSYIWYFVILYVILFGTLLYKMFKK